MFINIYGKLYNLSHVLKVEALFVDTDNLFTSDYQRTKDYKPALALSFNINDPVYVKCDSVEDRDIYFDRIEEKLGL